MRPLLTILAAITVAWLCACGGAASPPAKTVVTEQPKPAPKTVPAYPASIRKNDIEVVPVSLAIGTVPLKVIGGEGNSKDTSLVLTVRIVNHSKTKRLEFKGWPANQFLVNCGGSDEHGNAYKVVVFGINKIAGDSKGETIDPGKEATAIIPFEKPIDVASTFTIKLNGDSVGLDGEAFEWKAVRGDWE